MKHAGSPGHAALLVFSISFTLTGAHLSFLCPAGVCPQYKQLQKLPWRIWLPCCAVQPLPRPVPAALLVAWPPRAHGGGSRQKPGSSTPGWGCHKAGKQFFRARLPWQWENRSQQAVARGEQPEQCRGNGSGQGSKKQACATCTCWRKRQLSWVVQVGFLAAKDAEGGVKDEVLQVGGHFYHHGQ